MKTKSIPQVSKKIPGLRWYIGALLAAAAAINYIDRQTLSVASSRIKSDLHISQIQYGHTVQMFLVAYTFMYAFSGLLVDRWGTRKSLAIFDGWWSIANILNMFARGARSLSCFSFLLGMGEPGIYNAASRATSEWYPPSERAFINGLINMGSCIGAVMATPLVAWLMLWQGWRVAFLVTGLVGLIWILPWILLFYLPERHPLLAVAELNHIRSEEIVSTEPAHHIGIATLLMRRDTWGLMLTRFLSDPVWWFYLFWMPSFLQEQRGFTLTQIAVLGWLPYAASGTGSLLGGWLSNRLVISGRSTLQARLVPMFCCAAIMPISILIPQFHSMVGIITLLCITAFSFMAWKTNLMTITNDIYPTECMGTISGLLMVGSGIGGFLFQGLAAFMVQHFSYGSVFIITGFLNPVAFVVCYLALKPGRLIAHT